jgi:quinone-modifying oxidoreductase, subunit QmoC
MAEQVMSPDMKFIEEVLASGGRDLMKCYQCGTCCVVCNPTPDKTPFPRKEMLYAQWGMKYKLIKDPDIWLCHQCSDCTKHCPRGAKPGEVLGALRKIAIAEHSFPGFLGKAVGDVRYLILLFAVPVVIFLSILASLGNLNIGNIPKGEMGQIVYGRFLPVPYIDIVFTAAAAFAVLSFAIGVYKYWSTLMEGIDKSQLMPGSIYQAVTKTISEILAHSEFKKCDYAKGRTSAHLLTLYGFIGLAITTSWAVFYLYGLKWESPYPLTDPLKIWGNISAFVLLTGITLIVLNRLKTSSKTGLGSYFDWLLIVVVYTITVTGILAEVFRLWNMAFFAYPVYFLHLVFVFFLFIYAPFSKMAHMVYRTVALVFAKYVGNEFRLKSLTSPHDVFEKIA